MLYLVIINYYSSYLIDRLLKSLPKQTIIPYHVLIIDNSEANSDITNLPRYAVSKMTIIKSGKNIGFGCACNIGLNKIYSLDPHALVWLINPDTWLCHNTIDKVWSFFKKNTALSILGTLIYSADQKIWFSGGMFNKDQGKISSENLFKARSKKDYVTCDWVSGCSMIINLSHFSECPQFDQNYFLYYEDFDFCQRYKCQGHLVAVTNEISLTHQVSAITNCNLKNKYYHSTYSYLFTLERYTTKFVFYLRVVRLLTYALFLIPFKPMIALGKITGAWHYFQQRLSGVTPHTD